jgi:hypothetical protein
MKPILNTDRRYALRAASLILLVAVLTITSTRMRADTGACSGSTVTLPFTDVMGNPFFCSIASAFFSGLTNGTSATTYSPSANVPREQMAAFVSRTLEQSIRRNNLRAITKKWYLPPDPTGITLTTTGNQPQSVEFDGTDLWVANKLSDTVQRFRTSDGLLLETFTGADNVFQLVTARGRIFATGPVNVVNPGRLYFIDPTAGPGPVSILLSNLPAFPTGIAFDGARVWTANGSGSVSIITFNPTQATNVTAGFSIPTGILFDGANIWVTDKGPNSLLKLDASGNVVQSITVGVNPKRPVFDGINIWVPNNASNSVTMVRVKDSQGNPLATLFVLATLTGNGLNVPEAIAFDGERMLVTNFNGNSVSLFKAADLSPLGSISTGANTAPQGACSDGMNFWVTLSGTDKLARF